MIQKTFYPIFLLLSVLCFSQQNEEFRQIKEYYDYQRHMINSELVKRADKEKSVFGKNVVKQDFEIFMKKMDSIQNTALIGALIKVKNREDLTRLKYHSLPEIMLKSNKDKNITHAAEYPGGINEIRNHVVQNFYFSAEVDDLKTLKTNVFFIVEKDGSISSVRAEGENSIFNRQAEIAVYLLPEKFSPAKHNGQNVRYSFRLPLTMNVE